MSLLQKFSEIDCSGYVLRILIRMKTEFGKLILKKSWVFLGYLNASSDVHLSVTQCLLFLSPHKTEIILAYLDIQHSTFISWINLE